MDLLHTEAKAIAQESWTESDHNHDDAMDYLHGACDGLETVIYYYKAIRFCADHDTSDGEAWLEDCGGIAQDGDTFGTIACRIAYATILVKAQEYLHEISEAHEEAQCFVFMDQPETAEAVA